MIVRFRPEHLQSLILQDAQAWMRPMMLDGYGEQLLEEGPCYSMVSDAQVIACAGLTHIWEGRALAWSLLSASAGAHMVRLVKVIRRFLDAQDIRRIEATVNSDFQQGHRMAEMLGFTAEGVMRGYLPDGRDCHRYARVR